MNGGVKTHVDICGPHGSYGQGTTECILGTLLLFYSSTLLLFYSSTSCLVTLHIMRTPLQNLKVKGLERRKSISSDKAAAAVNSRLFERTPPHSLGGIFS